MRAAVVVLAVVLVLLHPAVAVAVVAAELAACGLMLGFIARALTPLTAHPYQLRRRVT